MLYKRLRKIAALLCTLTLLGAAACNVEPVENDSVKPTQEAKTEQPEDSEGQDKAVAEEKEQGENTQERNELQQEQSERTEPEVTVSPDPRELMEEVIRNQATETAERTATVRLSDSGAEITGTGCEMDGNRLKIKKSGVYEISGTLSNGSIYVNADNESEVHLILNSVTVHNETSAALFCKKAAKVTVTLAEGSVNTFSDGTSYVFEEGEDEPDATVYAKHDLVINGSGKLVVTSAYGDALKGKDSLYVLGGELVVNSADDGIVGRDLLYVADGTVAVTAAADALKASNDTEASLGNVVIDGGTFALTAENDGIQAENMLGVTGGKFTIKTGGGSVNAPEKTEDFGFGGGRGFGDWGNWGNRGETTGTETEETAVSAKGLKAGALLEVTGGTFIFDTCDDALHGNADVTVTGGDFSVVTGDDAIHADKKLLIEGSPKISITESYEGLEALEIVINGGEIDITADDDGLNAAGGNDGSGFGGPGMGMFGEGEGEITVNGGTVRVNASGDGFDSNGDLTINDGVIVSFGSTGGGEGALDYGGTFCLNGGTVFAAGGSVMGLAPSNSSGQYSLAAGLASQEEAGSRVEIVVNGEIVFSEEVPRQFNYIVASAKAFVKDGTVSVAVNGEVCYEGTLADVVTRFGTSGGMGGFGDDWNQGGFGGRGDRPQRPDGETPGGMWPGFSEGEMPQMPEGGWPGFFDGEFPQMPEGGWPGFQNGERPKTPDAGMSQGTDV